MGEARNLDVFFYPKSVAIIGASRDPKKTGNTFIQNLLNYGYQGTVYPVNPTEDEILGVKWPTLDLKAFTRFCFLSLDWYGA